jgi:sulfur-carrier protein
MRILYFSWLRERVGAAFEDIETEATTPAELVRELVARDERYAAAFADMRALRVAVDQEMADLETPLSRASEVAFFPPVTGG